jgi:RNA polymerase sigma-70 factor (ECF subfamily)
MLCVPTTGTMGGVGTEHRIQRRQEPRERAWSLRQRSVQKRQWYRLSHRGVPQPARSDWTAQTAEAPAAFHTREQKLTALLQDIAQGDLQALAALYDATSALVYSLALRILRESAAAEDVVIEVYMQVQRLASTYQQDRGTPSSWLLTLARSRAIDRLRVESLRQQREAPLEKAAALPSLTPDPEVSTTATELQRAVQTALLALSPEQRQVIEIAYYSGLSHSEIAARLRQPLGTVKTRLRTGMSVLRDLLRPFLEVQ